jgi:RNA polymerase sigma factor (sigma-70 family)
MVLREPELIDRFRAGDPGALETVYSHCVDYVTRTAAGVLRACATGSARGSGEMAAALADVVQEVFVKAFAPDARRRFDESRPYEPYLGQIARNVAVDHWRQMRRYVPSDLDQLIEKLSVEEAEANLRNDWSDPDTIAVVERYLASLDGATRRIHEALYVQGLSQREAAAALGLGRQTIRSTEAKLRRELRRELSRAERAVSLPFRSAVSKGAG